MCGHGWSHAHLLFILFMPEDRGCGAYVSAWCGAYVSMLEDRGCGVYVSMLEDRVCVSLCLKKTEGVVCMSLCLKTECVCLYARGCGVYVYA